MGEVWLAKIHGAAGFQKTVVIKKILPHLATEPDFVERFLDEGRLVVGLNHGNIAQVFDMGEVDSQYYIAMEYVEGCDLRELVRGLRIARKSVPVGIALYILAEVSEGLAYAHNRTDDQGEPLGVIHRDISPSNIMVSRDGAVKLVDFGVAKARSKLSNSIAGSVHGKFQYMSPEQASGKPLDHRSDLFSLGIVAYEMLSGQRPFDCDTDLATLDKIRNTDPIPLRQLRPDIPTVVAELVHECLAKDPDQRIENAAVLGRRIQEILYATNTMVTAQDVGVVVGELVDDLKHAPSLSLDDALLKQLQEHAPAQTATPSAFRTTFTANVSATPVGVDGAGHNPIADDLLGADGNADVESVRVRETNLVGLARWFVILFVLLVLGWVFVVYVRNESGSVPSVVPRLLAGNAVSPVGLNLSVPPLPTLSSSVTAANLRPPLDESARNERRDPESQAVGRNSDAIIDETSSSRTIQIESNAPHARMWLDGHGTFTLPHRVTLDMASNAIDGRVQADGYEEARFRIRPDGPRTVRVSLQPMVVGKVRFRYFPANARVLLDGQPLAVGGSNVVNRSLPPGAHTVEIIGQNGAKVVKTFEIRTGETTQLGTLEP